MELFKTKKSSISILKEIDISKQEQFIRTKSLVKELDSFSLKRKNLIEAKETLEKEKISFDVDYEEKMSKINICPFSKGEFFKSCKDKIKKWLKLVLWVTHIYLT